MEGVTLSVSFGASERQFGDDVAAELSVVFSSCKFKTQRQNRMAAKRHKEHKKEMDYSKWAETLFKGSTDDHHPNRRGVAFALSPRCLIFLRCLSKILFKRALRL
jgi:hypothetical protein